MHIYEDETFNDVYTGIVRDVMTEGLSLESRVSDVRELNPAIIKVNNPYHHLVTSQGRAVNVAFALAEVLWILGGRDEVEMVEFYNSTIGNYSDNGTNFNAAYGHRLRHAFGIDQIDQVVRTLSTDPNSRQASLVLSHPILDRGWTYNEEENEDGHSGWLPHETKDRACNVYAHLMIRQGRLNWLQVIRSNDLMWGTPYNWMQFTHLQQWIAGLLGVQMGHYTHVADSLHVYDYHFEEASRIHYFDLYEELGAKHQDMGASPGLLVELLRAEQHIRLTSKLEWSSNPSYWRDVLMVLQAHAKYKEGKDDAAYDILMSGDAVYAAAQTRFYIAKRWNHDKHQALLDRIAGDWRDEIFDWMTSGVGL